jgi:hypothetical protein
MGDLPAKLQEKWEKQHKKDAEIAFARVEKEGQAAAGPSFFQKAADSGASSASPDTVLQNKKE